MLSVSNVGGLVSDLAIIPFLVSCLGATIHAAILNRSYLRALATKSDWYRTPVPQSVGPSGQEELSFLGVSAADYYSAPPSTLATESAPSASNLPEQREPYGPPPVAATRPADQGSNKPRRPMEATGPVSVDTATVDTLSALPGISPALAKKIIDLRDARGRYRDFDDLASAANLQPHEIVRLRDHLAFDQADTQSTQNQPGGMGRILDI